LLLPAASSASRGLPPSTPRPAHSQPARRQAVPLRPTALRSPWPPPGAGHPLSVRGPMLTRKWAPASGPWASGWRPGQAYAALGPSGRWVSRGRLGAEKDGSRLQVLGVRPVPRAGLRRPRLPSGRWVSRDPPGADDRAGPGALWARGMNESAPDAFAGLPHRPLSAGHELPEGPGSAKPRPRAASPAPTKKAPAPPSPSPRRAGQEKPQKPGPPAAAGACASAWQAPGGPLTRATPSPRGGRQTARVGARQPSSLQ
jgi:hypothetical protein